MGRSHRNVNSTHILESDPQQRRNSKKSGVICALEQDECDIHVRTAELRMPGSLGSESLPHRVAADPVMLILFGINSSSCLVSNLVVNDAVGIFHQVLF